MPLDALMKQYAGAYVDSFEWPQPSPSPSEEDYMEETEGAFVIKKKNVMFSLKAVLGSDSKIVDIL